MKKNSFNEIVIQYLLSIYSNLSKKEVTKILKKIRSIFKKTNQTKNKLWSERDFFLITYADTIKKKKQKHFVTLGQFLKKFAADFSFVHILPFFPYSSDDGFAIKDYKEIKNENGCWKDLKKISSSFKIMSDLVINHCSSENRLFKDFLSLGKNSDFFIVSNNKFKISPKIVRPRSSDISKKVTVNKKDAYVWCTFSHDQVDFNFKNPDVLIFFLEIIKFYLDNNIKALRLDAVAFLWKEKNTNCINLPQTHEIIRLIRLIIDKFYGDVILITETNIPNHENLSYFGNNNEAHCIYNFSLAPLLIHSIVSADSQYLKKWSRSMPPAQERNAYLNFLSTHDGIGMRPVEGIIPKNELTKYLNHMKNQRGLFSYRKNKNKKSVYEINITLRNALKETYFGKDSYEINRFILAHTILFSMEGIPAVYIQNLIGSSNDYIKVKKTGLNRAINRGNWEFEKILCKLSDKNSKNYKILYELKKIINLRKKQPAFHPNATQFTLQLDNSFFGIWRQSLDRSQSIFCVSNLTRFKKKISLLDINLISINDWHDILTKKKIKNISGDFTLKPYQTFWITNKTYK